MKALILMTLLATFSCKNLTEGKARQLVVAIDFNQENKISYWVSNDDTYFITIRFSPDNKLILREPIVGDLNLEKERYTLNKSKLRNSFTIMTEQEFTDFASTGLPWQSSCPKCEWGNFENIFIAIKLANGNKYTLYKLAPVTIDI
ncbi:MAG: hypothetical protein WBA74_15805 [Cyclobacteriaceae bacterium]